MGVKEKELAVAGQTRAWQGEGRCGPDGREGRSWRQGGGGEGVAEADRGSAQSSEQHNSRREEEGREVVCLARGLDTGGGVGVGGARLLGRLGNLGQLRRRRFGSPPAAVRKPRGRGTPFGQEAPAFSAIWLQGFSSAWKEGH